jgi:cell division protein FtsQ
MKTKNILILNNNYYTDEQIIETCGIENYPKFIMLNRNKIKNKLKTLDLIKDVKITKKLDFSLEIEVTEKKLLYYIRSENKYMTSSGEAYKLDNVVGIPTLINYVPENIEASFIKEFSEIDSNIINMISEIEYNKNTYDDKRFLLYMNDGNEVYITISRIDLLNKYIDIVKKLNNKHGILYLDSGNYFEIKN